LTLTFDLENYRILVYRAESSDAPCVRNIDSPRSKRYQGVRKVPICHTGGVYCLGQSSMCAAANALRGKRDGKQ